MQFLEINMYAREKHLAPKKRIAGARSTRRSSQRSDPKSDREVVASTLDTVQPTIAGQLPSITFVIDLIIYYSE